MDAFSIPAYGKVNLTLKVLNRRPDGFHNLSTIFQNIVLHDTVTVRKRDYGVRLNVLGALLGTGPENLAYRAAVKMQQTYGFPGIEITLEKRIPIAAGLAGGSADAAAVLQGINRLYNLGLTPGQLAWEGSDLGSDVPFCAIGGTALGRGRGEELQILPPAPKLWLVLVKPAFGVSTEAVYNEWDKITVNEMPDPPDEDRALEAIRSGDREELIRALGNELEMVAARLYPEVVAVKKRLLDAGAKRAVMCGSGSAVFGVALNEDQAIEIAALIKTIYPETIITYTL